MPLAHGRPTGPQRLLLLPHTHLIEGCLSPSKPPMQHFPWLSTWLYWAPVVDGTVRPSFWKSLPTASGSLDCFTCWLPGRILGSLSFPEITLVKYYLDFIPPYLVHLVIMEEATGIYPPKKQISLDPLSFHDKLFKPQIAKEEKLRGYV